MQKMWGKMKSRLLIIIAMILLPVIIGSVYAVPYVNDDNLIDNLKKNQLPIGQYIYIDFIFFLLVLGGVIIGIIFVIRRKRK